MQIYKERLSNAIRKQFTYYHIPCSKRKLAALVDSITEANKHLFFIDALNIALLEVELS